MTIDEIKALRDAAYQAYLEAMQAKSLSFGGVNNRSITNQDLDKLRAEFERWDRELNRRSGQIAGGQFSLVRFRSE
jgi:hypothetical protein